MTDNQRRILEMLAEKKISIDEAERLLAVIGQPAAGETGASDTTQVSKSLPKYLRVVVTPGPDQDAQAKAEHVNIRVPLALIRAGMKFTAFIPQDKANRVNEALQSKGLDFDVRNLGKEGVEELIEALRDLEVNVDSNEGKVRIYAE